MVKFPLALLPVVTVAGGQARLAPDAYGVSTRTGTPAQAIASWAHAGAPWIHVVDADAVSGTGHHRDHMVRSAAHLQYSGGIRDDASLAAALATGASRVVIESDDVAWAAAALSGHDDRIAVGLDIRHPDVNDIGLELRRAGAQRFVVTDDATSHHWRHGDRHLLQEFCSHVHRPVMARGGIAHLSDLHALHELVPHGVDGILIDEALYDGSFTYDEAVSASADRFDLFFWGPPE
ncbi:MAG TPA: HisA/HisF-related TIM barrel protein [Candidatus Nanopelagicales bacterium]|nr:HisA/HisF-related TIM barrel protein [Candidatus Nanopelagicales bacterium]